MPLVTPEEQKRAIRQNSLRVLPASFKMTKLALPECEFPVLETQPVKLPTPHDHLPEAKPLVYTPRTMSDTLTSCTPRSQCSFSSDFSSDEPFDEPFSEDFENLPPGACAGQTIMLPTSCVKPPPPTAVIISCPADRRHSHQIPADLPKAHAAECPQGDPLFLAVDIPKASPAPRINTLQKSESKGNTWDWMRDFHSPFTSPATEKGRISKRSDSELSRVDTVTRSPPKSNNTITSTLTCSIEYFSTSHPAEEDEVVTPTMHHAPAAPKRGNSRRRSVMDDRSVADDAEQAPCDIMIQPRGGHVIKGEKVQMPASGPSCASGTSWAWSGNKVFEVPETARNPAHATQEGNPHVAETVQSPAAFKANAADYLLPTPQAPPRRVPSTPARAASSCGDSVKSSQQQQTPPTPQARKSRKAEPNSEPRTSFCIPTLKSFWISGQSKQKTVEVLAQAFLQHSQNQKMDVWQTLTEEQKLECAGHTPKNAGHTPKNAQRTPKQTDISPPFPGEVPFCLTKQASLVSNMREVEIEENLHRPSITPNYTAQPKHRAVAAMKRTLSIATHSESPFMGPRGCDKKSSVFAPHSNPVPQGPQGLPQMPSMPSPASAAMSIWARNNNTSAGNSPAAVPRSPMAEAGQGFVLGMPASPTFGNDVNKMKHMMVPVSPQKIKELRSQSLLAQPSPWGAFVQSQRHPFVAYPPVAQPPSQQQQPAQPRPPAPSVPKPRTSIFATQDFWVKKESQAVQAAAHPATPVRRHTHAVNPQAARIFTSVGVC